VVVWVVQETDCKPAHLVAMVVQAVALVSAH
jgi:hypothetical protein